MSTYLDFKLKMKGHSVDQAPTVLFLTTTPARELADKINFNWDSENTSDEYKCWNILSLEMLKDIQNEYQNRIQEMKQNIVKYSAEAERYREMLPKAVNRENFEMIEQKIDDAEEMVSWAKEEKETAEYRWYDFDHLELLLIENTEFELVYSIG